MSREKTFHNRKLVNSPPDPLSPRPSRSPYPEPLASLAVWIGLDKVVSSHQVTLDLTPVTADYVGSNQWQAFAVSQELYNVRSIVTWNPLASLLNVNVAADPSGTFATAWNFTWTNYPGRVNWFTGITPIGAGSDPARNASAVLTHGPYRLPSV